MTPSRFERFVAEGRPFVLSRHAAAVVVNEVLLDIERRIPVVGVSTCPILERCLVDAEQLARELRWRALVVVVGHGAISKRVSRDLPGLGVFGGFVRLWAPGLRRNSPRAVHKLFPVRGRDDGERVLRQVVRAVASCPPWSAPPRAEEETGTPERGASLGGSAVPYDPSCPTSHELGWWTSRG